MGLPYFLPGIFNCTSDGDIGLILISPGVCLPACEICIRMQISHAGRQTPGEINMSPMSPSDVQLKIPGRKYGKPIPMTEEDIQDVINRFVFTAKIARES